MQSASVQGCFWGVRGSFPSGRTEHQFLGGNTPCLVIQATPASPTLAILIVDAGTGLLAFGLDLLARYPDRHFEILLCISHAHWDHIAGFPAFVELLGQRATIRIASLKRPNRSYSIENSLRWQQERCPQPWEQFESQLQFIQLDEKQPLDFYCFQIATVQLNHPGISSGFLISFGDDRLAYISDIAPICDILLGEPLFEEETEGQLRQRLYDNELWLAEHAHTVIYDTFFTEPDYRGRPHWGHATIERALNTCSLHAVQRLILFHHNSEYSDAFQRTRIANLQSNMEVWLAREREPFPFASPPREDTRNKLHEL